MESCVSDHKSSRVIMPISYIIRVQIIIQQSVLCVIMIKIDKLTDLQYDTYTEPIGIILPD